MDEGGESRGTLGFHLLLTIHQTLAFETWLFLGFQAAAVAVFLADQAVPSGTSLSLEGFASLPHASVYSLPSAEGPAASSWMLPEAGPPLPQVRYCTFHSVTWKDRPSPRS